MKGPKLLLDHVILTRKSLKSKTSYDVIQCNIDVVNYLLEEGAEMTELSPEALASYHVDFYQAQVSNGGIDQFVANSGWAPEVIHHVVAGLEMIGAKRHQELFARVQQTVDSLDDEVLAVMSEDLFTDDRCTAFDQLSDEFFDLGEDLIDLNAAFLRGLPNLKVVKEKELVTRLDAVIATIEDLEERLARRAAEWEANKPRYMRVIDVICAEHGWELDMITAGDPTAEYQGESAIGWHFITDAGHHSMIDLGEKAVVFDDDDKEIGFVDLTGVPAE